MSELEAYILIIAVLGVIFGVPIYLVFMEVMRKWRASVALTPAEKRKVGEFAAAHFGDPLAAGIDWVPLKFGGSPQRGYRLVRTGPQSLEFRMTSKLPAPKGLLIGFGSLFLVIGYLVLVEGAELAHAVFAVFLMVLGGGLLIILIFWFSYRRAFDLDLGFYWSTFSRMGPCPAVVVGNPSEVRPRTPRCGRIADIHSLQILSEKVQTPQQRKGLPDLSGKPPPVAFLSYELNLVLKNGVRVNVVDHGDLESLRSDARELSSFLGIPVWDSTGEWPESADSVESQD